MATTLLNIEADTFKPNCQTGALFLSISIAAKPPQILPTKIVIAINEK